MDLPIWLLLMTLAMCVLVLGGWIADLVEWHWLGGRERADSARRNMARRVR